MGDISLKGKSPILRQSFAVGGIAKHAVRRITDRLGGGKEGKPHSTKAGRIAAGVRKLKRKFNRKLPRPEGFKSSEAMVKEGGRRGLNKGGKPWGTGPKPGTHEFMVQNLHKRKGKAAGSIVKGVGALVKKFKKKKVYPETEDLTHQVGPYAGDVGSEGKRRTMGPRGRGKSPGRPKAGPQAPSRPKKTWPPKHRDFLKRYPKMPQPHKAPGDKPYIPMPKHDPHKPKKWKEAAEGGRIGFKKGTDKKWMQKVSASIKKRGTKGKCTPITKPGCTGRAKALARTFKKIGRERKAKG